MLPEKRRLAWENKKQRILMEFGLDAYAFAVFFVLCVKTSGYDVCMFWFAFRLPERFSQTAILAAMLRFLW